MYEDDVTTKASDLRESEVQNQLKYLAEQRLLLDKVLANLTNKLQPVCFNTELNKGESSDLKGLAVKSRCELASNIRYEADGLSEIVERINKLTSTIQL